MITITIRKGILNIFLYDLVSFHTRHTINNIIYYSAIFLAIGVCFYLAYKRLMATGYTKKQAAGFSLITGLTAFPLGIASSRAANMFYSPPEMWSITAFFTNALHGGTHTFHTCWVLPTIMSILTAKFLKIRISEIFDIEFLYMPVGHAIGRVACLLVGCCWGNEATYHIGKTIVHYHVPIPALAIINNLLLFLFLRYLFNKIYYEKIIDTKITELRSKNNITRKIFSGAVIGSYLSGYAINRFFLEYYRTEKIVVYNLTQAQLAMILYMTTGILFFTMVSIKYYRVNTQDEQ